MENISNAIKKRVSVRTYEERRLTEIDKNKVFDVVSQSSNPFGAQVRISYIEKAEAAKGEKLGTYGTIKGASSYLGLAVAPGEDALLAAGYQFEEVVLKLTEMGLGTVWLAATFSRDTFAKAMNITDEELFPAISPVGYPYKKRSLTESIMRKAMKSNNRKDWSELFFDGSFESPLTTEAAGVFANALEMVRIGPSATNSQPWRIVRDGEGNFHFYETHKAGTSQDELSIKQVDLGIALCHFDLAAKEEGLEGAFEKKQPEDIEIPENTGYVMSWKPL